MGELLNTHLTSQLCLVQRLVGLLEIVHLAVFLQRVCLYNGLCMEGCDRRKWY